MTDRLSIDTYRLSSYAYRLDTFNNWIYDGRSKCTAEKLARSGFYRPRADLNAAQCFVCLKELEGWEPDDDPDKEHRTHSPKCPFLTSKQYEEMTVEEGLKMDVERYCIHVNKLIAEHSDIHMLKKTFKKFSEALLSRIPKRRGKRTTAVSNAESCVSDMSLRSTRSTRSRYKRT
ncbi:unnamed protein product [Trichobilharzia szidati]|nr:unnamed protein product [Trichobilharzia szidati]